MSANDIWKRIIESNIFWFIMGGLVSLGISGYYNQVTSKQQRSNLLENGLLEAKLNTSSEFYDSYINNSEYQDAGHPFPYLINLSFQEIYKNSNLFDPEDSSLKSDLIGIVIKGMRRIDEFNSRINLRNNSILTNLDNVKEFNEGAFRSYDRSIIPILQKYGEFVEKNKEKLIE